MVEDNVELQGVHMGSSGEFYFKKRVGWAYETVHVNKDLVYPLNSYYCKSKSFLGLSQAVVGITPVQKESRIEHCWVFYSFDSVMKEEEASVFLHGNASKRICLYIHMSRETMEKLRDNLSSGKSVIEVYDLTLKESWGPLKSMS